VASACGGALRYAAGEMLITADSLGQTLALLATFLGIGLLVNFLIVYILAQVFAERKENKERQARLRE
jgi:hypothetical protein